MNFKLWCPEEIEKADENQLFLRLDTCKDHEEIHLIVCKKDGECIQGGHILYIHSILNAIILSDYISPHLPLKSDIQGIPLVISEPELNALRDKLHKQELNRQIAKKIEEEISNNHCKH